jgi:ribonuclease HI
MIKIIAYTDGSCYWLTKFGGYGIYMKIFKENTYKVRFFQQGLFNTKTGRTELHAIINCFKKINDKTVDLTIYSDSKYAINCINAGWLYAWEKNGFTSGANQDLMPIYLKEFRKFKMKPILKHIKGHQTDLTDDHIFGNNVADVLADYKQFNEYTEDEKLTYEKWIDKINYNSFSLASNDKLEKAYQEYLKAPKQIIKIVI